MSNPEVKVGDTVFYSPAMDHQFDRGPGSLAGAKLLFEFVHEANAPNSAHRYKKGDVVQNPAALGKWSKTQNGVVTTLGGHVIRATRSLFGWKATVRAVFADGTLALDIVHPRGSHTLHYPSEGKTGGGIPYSKAPSPHTWHAVEDEAPTTK